MKLIILFTISITLVASSVAAKQLVFALVPKNDSYSFFKQSEQGCMAAAKELQVSCIYRGPSKSDVRLQNEIIEQLIEEGVDGIAISVTQSNFLAKKSMQKAIKAGIPVVTFDADFDIATRMKFPNIRRAYVGSNNFELGLLLGRQLKKHRPQGGRLIIQTGRPDSPNLNERVLGIRTFLSGDHSSGFSGGRLNNNNGWTEVRAPFPSYGIIKRAKDQMKSAFSTNIYSIDVFVAVGGWAQLNAQAYRKMMQPFKTKLTNKDIFVVMADTEKGQLELLKEGLSHVNIGQSSYEMGRRALVVLHSIVTKQAYKEINYTPLTLCNQQNYTVCNNPLKYH